MVGEMQFMIVYSGQDARMQKSKGMLIDQEKQEISAEVSFAREVEALPARLRHLAERCH
jgi:hypothetical protein